MTSLPLKPQLDTPQFPCMFSQYNAQLTVTVSELLSSGSLGFSCKEISRGALACDCSVKSPQTHGLQRPSSHANVHTKCLGPSWPSPAALPGRSLYNESRFPRRIRRAHMADDRELASAIKNLKSASRQLKLIALKTKTGRNPLLLLPFFFLRDRVT